MSQRDSDGMRTGLEIAVIGMAGRFPGAANISEFWENLKKGVESISFFTAAELEESGRNPRTLSNPDYVKASGYLQDTGYFDPVFFHYTPLEAQIMDPQLRIYHECIWEALEDAGCNPDTFTGPIGVYSGAVPNSGWAIQALKQSTTPAQYFDAYSMNLNSAFGTLISYNLNLQGPSFSLQTACSTSLVAIHLACQGLLNAECDIALAGGISVNPFGKTGYPYQEGMINSDDGHCRVFDARSNGTLGGEGVGIVVLKRLDEAVREGNHIYALIKGSAINNDGTRKVGYTAPSVDGQAEVIWAALEAAEVEPDSISYIEAHGTGTTLGDPVEIEGLKLVFGTGEEKRCGIGSVKSNIGHLDTAAGVAGFIKTVLALQHRMLPPSLHFENPNPKVDFVNSPFYVVRELSEWRPGRGDAGDDPALLRAGVSSFGIGGTNAHVVLEEPHMRGAAFSRFAAPGVKEETGSPDVLQTSRWPEGPSGKVFAPLFSKSGPPEAGEAGHQLVLLSARTRSALDRMALNLKDFFNNNPGIDLADAAYTLQAGRKTFKHRGMFVCSTGDEAIEILSNGKTGKLHIYATMEENRPVILMFPGQGSQYVDMGRGLYESQPVFRQVMDECFEILKSRGGPGVPPSVSSEPIVDINRTDIAQPLIFMMEYAMAKMLLAWGLQPAAMIGHSIGEYTAACLAGVFSLEDALKLVALRGKLMQQMPTGDMLGIALPEKELIPLLNDELSVAAVNGPANCVVSGSKEAVAAFVKQLKEKGVESRLLHTSHAFHSKLMDPAVEKFSAEVGRFTLNEPQQPFISNVSGTWISGEEAVDPGYWAAHLRKTVRFSDGLGLLLEEIENAVFVEAGPGRVLSTLTRQHPGKKQSHSTLNLVRHPKEDAADDRFLLEQVGRLWQRGGHIDWRAFHGEEKRRLLSLPTYPFERQSFAIDSYPGQELEKGEVTGQPGKRTDISTWFYLPSWTGGPLPAFTEVKRSAAAFGGGLSPDSRTEGSCWLILSDECGLGSALVKRLQDEQQIVVTVSPGDSFQNLDDGVFCIDPQVEDDYDTLFKTLKAQQILPGRIIHLWNVSREETEGALQQVDRQLEAAFYSLLYIVRASGRQRLEQSIHMDVVSTGLHRVVGNEILCPTKAALLGPVRVIPLEYSGVKCRSFDIEYPRSGDFSPLLDDLLAEFDRESTGQVIALRGRSRWVQGIEPLRFDNDKTGAPRLKEQGVYLITGGLGGMGLTFASQLAKDRQARLVLTDKPGFPDETEWDQWLDTHKDIPGDLIGMKIQRLRQLRRQGAEIMVCPADAAVPEEMRAVIEKAEKRFGSINGVIHAAGLPDGGLIQVRGRRQSEAVLAPKVAGTLILSDLLQSRELDFFLLCSSLSSELASAGQVAYNAANSFLDAFACYRTAAGGTFTLAVNWDSWREVGMAVATVEQLAGAKTVAHPLIDLYVYDGSRRHIYISRFFTGRFWVLDDHRILGKATLPGTAYVEMAGAAFNHYSGSATFEISDLMLLAPLSLDEDEQKTIHTVLEEEGEGIVFSTRSRNEGKGDTWQEHARGKITALSDEKEGSPSFNLKEVKNRLENRVKTLSEGRSGEPAGRGYLQVGPRWNTAVKQLLALEEGLVELELPEDFISDLKDYRLHPALLDTATAFLSGSYRLDGPLLPFLFKRVRVRGALPRRIFSYSRVKANPLEKGPVRKNLAFNIMITDEQGRPVVEVEEFTLVAVSTGSAGRRAVIEEKSIDPLQDGILPAEGVDVLYRLLAGAYPRVMVSTIDLPERLRLHHRQEKKSSVTAAAPVEFGGPAHPRPEISSDYSAPENKSQQRMATIWQNSLGIGNIGIDDDFFELGGDSLKGLTVISELQKTFNVEMSITDFFAAPTVRGLNERLSAGYENIYAAIDPIEEREYYPLSSAQKRLYFLQQLQPESVVYNIPNTLIVEGRIDETLIRRFEAAFRELIRRQESLRTTFHLAAGQPVQKIHAAGKVNFSLSYCGEEGKETVESEAHIIENFVRPFDLTRSPLMRVELVRMETDRHLWLFDIHHIVSDATGLAILYKNIFSLIDGEEPSPLRTRYRDFSQWQNGLFDSGIIAGQRDYWMNIFSEAIPEMRLPTDYPRPEVATFAGDMHLFRLPAEETFRFLEAGAAVGATLFMNLTAVLNVLLFKYTGISDIVIGSSIAGRPHADLQDIIGMFVNMLAIRNYPAPKISYVEFLQQVKAGSLTAFENQDMQYEMLVEELGLKGDTTRSPLFDVCINVQNYEQPQFTVEGLSFRHGGFRYRNAKFDMLLWANRTGDELHFMLEYSTELFKPETAREFGDHLLQIIDQVGRNKEIRLADIDLSYRVMNPTIKVPEIDFDF